MAANTDKFRKMKSNYSSTLSGPIASGDTTIGVSSLSGIPTDTAVTMTIDRVDANGVSTPTKVERVIGTNNGSNQLTNCLRGQDTSSAAAHASGAVVEMIWDALTWNDHLSALLVEHNQDGTHNNTIVSLLAAAQTFLAVKTFTTGLLKAADIIDTVNALKVVVFTGVASAVNWIILTASATGNAVSITPGGSDTNIELKLGSKGNKQINLSSGHYQPLQAYTPAGGATATLDLSLGNDHRITMPAGNITIALSNEQVGQKFLVTILQDGVGSRTVSWFTTIKWAGGVAPTLTTAASKKDTFGFVVTAAGTYDGFVVGQNL